MSFPVSLFKCHMVTGFLHTGYTTLTRSSFSNVNTNFNHCDFFITIFQPQPRPKRYINIIPGVSNPLNILINVNKIQCTVYVCVCVKGSTWSNKASCQSKPSLWSLCPMAMCQRGGMTLITLRLQMSSRPISPVRSSSDPCQA